MSDEQLSPTATVVIAERRQRRWSQARLAEELAAATQDEGWKRPRVARLESDRIVIDLDTIQALSRVFDLDYATLIDGYARRDRSGGVRYGRRSTDTDANVNPWYVSDTFGPNPMDLLTCDDDLLVGAAR